MPPRRATNQRLASTGLMDQVPTWIRDEFTTTTRELEKLEDKVFNLEVAINTLKEHASQGTAPKSLAISTMVKVNQKQQEAMDKIIEDAKHQFQLTVLQGLIDARTRELNERKADISRLSDSFLSMMEDTLDMLISNDILRIDAMEATSERNTIQNIFKITTDNQRADIRTKGFLHHRKKCEDDRKRQLQREERNINNTLQDSDTRIIMARLSEVEKQVQTIKPKPGKKSKENNLKILQQKQRTRPKPSPRQPRTHNKPGPSLTNSRPNRVSPKTPQTQRRGHPKGSGRVGGRGNPKQQRGSTPSTVPSASLRQSYRPKQN